MALYKKDMREALRAFRNKVNEQRCSAGGEKLQYKEARMNKKNHVTCKLGNLFIRAVRDTKKGGVKIIKKENQ